MKILTHYGMSLFSYSSGFLLVLVVECYYSDVVLVICRLEAQSL